MSRVLDAAQTRHTMVEGTGADTMPGTTRRGLWCRGLEKEFPGGTTAVSNLDLDIAEGEFVTLLGPSGSGKTTALRMLIGLERPTNGEVGIGDTVLSSRKRRVWVPPNDRNFGMVFQQYAVWPHMTVADNIAFPLKVRRRPRAEIKESVQRALRLIGMSDYADRSVTKLSGGQQQRVAIARAIAYSPPVLLLDEPLSNLDVWLRRQLREELKDLQVKLGVTTVYVTHDQSEAFALSDRIALMHDSRLEQLATPQALFSAPQTVFAAEFVGSSNIVPLAEDAGQAVEIETGSGRQRLEASRPAEAGERAVAFKPEHGTIVVTAGDCQAWPCRVSGMAYAGDRWEVRGEIGELTVRTTQASVDGLQIGCDAFVSVPPAALIPVTGAVERQRPCPS